MATTAPRYCAQCGAARTSGADRCATCNAAFAPPQLDVAEVARTSITAYGREFLPLTKQAASLFVPVGLAVLLLTYVTLDVAVDYYSSDDPSIADPQQENNIESAKIDAWVFWVTWPAYTFTALLLQTLHVDEAQAVHAGIPRKKREPVALALRRLGPQIRSLALLYALGAVALFVGSFILGFLGAMLGLSGQPLTLLVLLGTLAGYAFVYQRFSLLVPVVVLEGQKGTAALRRSAELSRGNHRRLMLMAMGIVAATAVTVAILKAWFDGLVLGSFFPEFLADWVPEALFAPFAALLWTASYRRLREVLAASAPAAASVAGHAAVDPAQR